MQCEVLFKLFEAQDVEVTQFEKIIKSDSPELDFMSEDLYILKPYL